MNERYFMDLSIIVVSWNTKEILADCLDSIYNCPPECRFEVRVVDNASTDGTIQMLFNRFPQVNVVESFENLGFARANNLAISLARNARYILLLNPDTVVIPGALQEMVNYMDENPNVGAVGPRLLNPDGSLQTSCYAAPTLAREFTRMFHLSRFINDGCYQMEEWDSNKARDVDIIQGACLMLRRTALDQVGVLDESFFIYSEDFDLCYRLQKNDWGLVWLPGAEVIHYGAQSTNQVSVEMFMHLYQAKLMFMRKHYGRRAVPVYKLILFFSALPRVMLIPWAWMLRRQQQKNLAKKYSRLVSSLPGM
jgi:GT2 family glycosyltransferase